MMEIIKRDYYIEKLLNFKNTNVAKVLIGIRKCGKTEILKQFINIVKTQGDTVLFYDLNDYDIRTKYIKEGVLYNEIKKNLKQTNKTYIFIDEVQEVERWDEVVNSLVRNKNIDLYITGSNSKVLSSNLPTILKGVTVPIYVFPLSFNEIKDHSSYKGKTDEFILEEYVRYGGMPGRLSFGTEQTLDYLKMVYSEILEVDILSKKIINNVDELIKIYNFILSNIGRVISTNNISLTLKNHNNTSIKNETVIKYADWLSAVLLLNKIEIWSERTKNMLKNYSKYYSQDIGLANSRADVPFAYALENIVLSHLKINGYEVFSYGNNEDKEIDFVAKKNKETIFIQVAYEVVPNEYDKNGKVLTGNYHREIGNLRELKNSNKKIVISYKNKTYTENDGIQVINLLEWLKSIV